MNSYPELVAVGHICTDKIHICEDFPAENTSKHVLEYTERPGGTASQAIVAASRLGANTGFINYFGDDSCGRALYKGCVEEGIDLSQCITEAGVVASFTNVLVNKKKSTRTFLSYHGQFSPIEFTTNRIEYLRHARILHLDGTNYTNAFCAAGIAKKCGVTVSLDGSSMQTENEKNWRLAELADILIVNETYPTRLTGIADPCMALMEMRRELPCEVLISTVGEKGCIVLQNNQLWQYPCYPVSVVDTTGAGDAFHGAFLFGTLRGYGLDKNIRFSSAVAAHSCTAIGGREGLPTWKQADTLMKSFSLDPVKISNI
ncbi:MAG: PfkB family carbohydrate kinase [Lachnospiraceae bacterium]|nr:PfkB family carbohydrate kinase [Lachnospiraceae bacterium]